MLGLNPFVVDGNRQENIRAVWDCWQNGTRLNYDGDYFKLDLMVPLFDAGPVDHPDIPVHLAAVKPVMSRVAGEVADGLRPHPVCTPGYIRDVMLPAVREGAAKAGRSLGNFDVCMKPLVASARTEEDLVPKIRDARARIAFYASTPAYRDAFDYLGLGALADEAKHLSRSQNWEDLPGLIDDAVLHQFAVIGTYDDIAQKLVDRWADIVTHAEFSIAVENDDDRDILADIARTVQAGGEDAARQAILGQ